MQKQNSVFVQNPILCVYFSSVGLKEFHIKVCNSNFLTISEPSLSCSDFALAVASPLFHCPRHLSPTVMIFGL